MTKVIVADTETNGLAYDCDKIHVMAWTEGSCEYCNSTGKVNVAPWENDGTPGLPEWDTCEECGGSGVLVHHTPNYDEMREIYDSADILVMHGGVTFDQVVFNRILEIQLDYRKYWDSLALSWYLFPDRKSHGLEAIGVEHGVKKPEVTDWHNLSYEEYAHRCSEDVKINHLEFMKQKKRLEEIYG